MTEKMLAESELTAECATGVLQHLIRCRFSTEIIHAIGHISFEGGAGADARVVGLAAVRITSGEGLLNALLLHRCQYWLFCKSARNILTPQAGS